MTLYSASPTCPSSVPNTLLICRGCSLHSPFLERQLRELLDLKVGICGRVLGRDKISLACFIWGLEGLELGGRTYAFPAWLAEEPES